MNTFTNLQAFGDWALRLVVTLVAIAGTVDRLVKRMFKRYFDDNIATFSEKLTTIETEIKTHNHQKTRRKLF